MNKQKKGLVPELRFPEFEKEPNWPCVRLNAVAKRSTSKNKGEKITRVLTNSAVNGVVDQRDYFDKDIAVKGNLESYYIVDKGDYVYNPRISSTAPVGPISKNKVGKGVMSPLYTIFRFNSKSNDFFEQFFKSSRWHGYLKSISNSGARHDRMSITSSEFMAMPVPNPGDMEKQKIADCLASIDELIALHTQKIDALKDHKKGLMQQLFPAEGETVPKLRFSEFRKSGKWNLSTVQSLIDSKIIIGHLDGNHGSLYPRSDEFSKEGVPYITANDFVHGEVNFNNCKYLSIDRANLFKKGVAKNGDILFAHNATVGPVAKLKTDLNFVILSTTATYFRCDNKRLLNDFLLFSLESPSFVKQYKRVMSQSTRNQVPITTQRKFTLCLPPEFGEQEKIASSLFAMDELIFSQVAKLDKLKVLKLGLVQKLFPVMDDVV